MRFFICRLRSIVLVFSSALMICLNFASKAKDLDSDILIYCIGNQNSTGSCISENQYIAEEPNSINCLIASWPFVKCTSGKLSKSSKYDCFALSNTSNHNQISLSCKLSIANDESQSIDDTHNAKMKDQSEGAYDLETNDADQEALTMKSPFNQTLDERKLQEQKPQDFNKAFN